MLQKIANGIDAINDWIGNKIVWLTLIMALVMFVNVVLRYAFDMGWIWMQESVTYMHGVLFMVSGGFSLLHNQHVRIDIVYDKVSERKKAVIDLFGTFFLLLPTCVVIFYYAYPYVRDSWAVLEDSMEAGGLPGVYLLKTIILVFSVLVGLQGISKALRAILTLSGSHQSTPTTAD
jgi:TRAP-type mannitol/chloroaromatic compound transport system permease small subunit